MRGVLCTHTITCMFSKTICCRSDASTIGKVTQVTIVGPIVQVSIPYLRSGEGLTQLLNIILHYCVVHTSTVQPAADDESLKERSST